MGCTAKPHGVYEGVSHDFRGGTKVYQDRCFHVHSAPQLSITSNSLVFDFARIKKVIFVNL